MKNRTNTSRSWHQSNRDRAAGIALCGLMLLGACTPKLDWREVAGTAAPYTVLLPSKPSTYARSVNLGGIHAEMSMTAAEVDEVSYAVGSAELADATQAQAALAVMKDTLVANIGGVVRHEKSVVGNGSTQIELEAGPKPGGRPIALHARFIAAGRRVYQVIVIGPEKSVRPEAVETFLTSFKLPA